MRARRVQTVSVGINSQVLKAKRLSPLGDWPFSQKLPNGVEYLDSFVNRIGDINSIGGRIDRDRTKAYELSIATSLAAPTRKDLTVGTELHDSVATRIDNINRIIRANGDLSRPI